MTSIVKAILEHYTSLDQDNMGNETMKSVLIVDDSIFMRSTLREFLQQNGFRVAGEAKDGEEAVARYDALRPDLVLMDLSMPKMGGRDAIKAIMELDPTAKVLVVSAMGQRSIIAESVQFGAKGFIVKPFTPGRLLKDICRILGIPVPRSPEGKPTTDMP